MSRQYDVYLEQHISNVQKGFWWLADNLPELLHNVPCTQMQINNHDSSKTNTDEYRAYDEYFYGNNRSHSVVKEYEKAWLLHIHRNPHHWQYWVLVHDDPEEDITCIEMPMNYILEMICDWWAFSWAKENLYEIFSWYDEHKQYMKLHKNTRKQVEDILGRIKKKLDESKEEKDG